MIMMVVVVVVVVKSTATTTTTTTTTTPNLRPRRSGSLEVKFDSWITDLSSRGAGRGATTAQVAEIFGVLAPIANKLKSRLVASVEAALAAGPDLFVLAYCVSPGLPAALRDE
jgi:maltose-binding protein MalE